VDDFGQRYAKCALEAMLSSHGLIVGNEEVRDRIVALYPDHAAQLLSGTRIVGVGVDTSLFAPVAPPERPASIAKLINGGPYGGKTEEQCNELFTRIDNDMEKTFAPLVAYRDAYTNAYADVGMPVKLASIPFGKAPVMLFVGALTSGKGVQSLIMAMPAILKRVPDAHLVVVGSGAYREVLEGLVHILATANGEMLDAVVAHGWELDINAHRGGWVDVKAYLDAHDDDDDDGDGDGGDGGQIRQGVSNRTVVLGAGATLSHHIHFIGRLDHDLLQHLFPCCDLAIFPSIVKEAYPLVLMESLSNGVFPLAPNFSGFKCGLNDLVPFLGADVVERLKLPCDNAKRVDGIVRSVVSMVRAPDRQHLRSKLRQIAVDHYDW